ncbi:MAG: HAMP domain-containing protein [Saccharospirillaceae bacterium]|nr:HAMP domain-containing protein [Pseudomonadales bacterium]NRB79964.1 HAMP domain-containing protein [Saccharospirillaceae bacterium]
MFQFHRFQSRIIFYILILSLPIQLILFLSIRDANINTARKNINENLEITSQILFNTLNNDRDNLLSNVRALSYDYAFKQVANTNEHQTILSSLESYQNRVDADVMLLISMDNQIIADTQQPNLTGSSFYLPQLIQQASKNQYGEANRIDFINEQPYLLVAMPLFSPQPSHWIVMGFLLTDRYTQRLQGITKSEVSILYGSDNTSWKVLASTLHSDNKQRLADVLTQKQWQYDLGFDLQLSQRYLTVVLAIQNDSQTNPQSAESNKNQLTFISVAQRSLDEALAPYQSLQFLILSVFALSLVTLIIGGFLIARTITKPIIQLKQGAKKIEQGQYDFNIDIPQQDELGNLAQQFNAMAKGLAERGQVRSLLGKVVSPAIAEQLINNGVELGGETRQVTILFSDIRNFTSMCEAQSAEDIILTLNKLLTVFSHVIDSHQGVIDKYIGDAVMALFGAPIEDDQQAQHAVLAALALYEKLADINQELVNEGIPKIGLGIGINTDAVVAGNMGSSNRLNYTVIGDGVNLSARLEGLTKFYKVPILVSKQTVALCPNIVFREIDCVKVKGKNQGIHIFEPLGLSSNISAQQTAEIKLYQAALTHYQQQHWVLALKMFTRLQQQNPETGLYQLYLQRVNNLIGKEFDEHWDVVFTHTSK